MEELEAAVRVLEEETKPLHWTVIQDLALRRGYVDPFVTSDVRGRVLSELAAAVREGQIRKDGRGVYVLAG